MGTNTKKRFPFCMFHVEGDFRLYNREVPDEIHRRFPFLDFVFPWQLPKSVTTLLPSSQCHYFIKQHKISTVLIHSTNLATSRASDGPEVIKSLSLPFVAFSVLLSKFLKFWSLMHTVLSHSVCMYVIHQGSKRAPFICSLFWKYLYPYIFNAYCKS
jgi:hypothetical protein